MGWKRWIGFANWRIWKSSEAVNGASPWKHARHVTTMILHLMVVFWWRQSNWTKCISAEVTPTVKVITKSSEKLLWNHSFITHYYLWYMKMQVCIPEWDCFKKKFKSLSRGKCDKINLTDKNKFTTPSTDCRMSLLKPHLEQINSYCKHILGPHILTAPWCNSPAISKWSNQALCLVWYLHNRYRKLNKIV